MRHSYQCEISMEGHNTMRTSLTGMDDTPTSLAMNHAALQG